MSGFSSFLISLCAACVFIGALHMICPDGVMADSVKYLLSVVFLVSVLSVSALPLGHFSPEPFHVQENAESETDLTVAAAKYVYTAALQNAGINFREITVCTDKSEDGSIIISKLIIRSDCEETKIKDALGAAAEHFEIEVIP